jgi:hypothetical protein
LVRDQEVEGSNPFAPTTFSLIFIGLFITLLPWIEYGSVRRLKEKATLSTADEVAQD